MKFSLREEFIQPTGSWWFSSLMEGYGNKKYDTYIYFGRYYIDICYDILNVIDEFLDKNTIEELMNRLFKQDVLVYLSIDDGVLKMLERCMENN